MHPFSKLLNKFPYHLQTKNINKIGRVRGFSCQYLSESSLNKDIQGVLIKNNHMFSSSSEAKKLIDAIRDQTEGVPNHLVFVLDIVSVRFGGYFTPEIKA